ncbi:MAG: hypothetical protein C4532_16765 [Candidatus Abyssobacteria bacterium SURF_17]|uniref:B box-type domain-containing protein n=1 Tax=Candidatus Abyssobacteria bacterium SURF_17 TaxID=2093361 RepID=A0A419ER32_9BACT|nr:MAG: hypothetical protein C4532_16765 [Candidatus Abyssubacteria bacterium SURF_17]
MSAIRSRYCTLHPEAKARHYCPHCMRFLCEACIEELP